MSCTNRETPTRVFIVYCPETGKVKGKVMPIFDWSEQRHSEKSDNIFLRSEFASVFIRENGDVVVYATTHYDAQKALNTTLTASQKENHHG